jgi:hypothetical protein
MTDTPAPDLNRDRDTAMDEYVIRETLASTAAYRGRAILYGTLGTAAIILASGLAIAAVIWAWNHILNPDMLKAALADMPPAKVEVALKDGATVALKDGGTVRLDNDSLGAFLKSNVQPKDANGKIINREVTVFTTIEHKGTDGQVAGSVMTGWTFQRADSTTPTYQFCYFITPIKDNTSQRYNIASTTDATKSLVDVVDAKTSPIPNFDQALNECVWWKAGVI